MVCPPPLVLWLQLPRPLQPSFERLQSCDLLCLLRLELLLREMRLHSLCRLGQGFLPCGKLPRLLVHCFTGCLNDPDLLFEFLSLNFVAPHTPECLLQGGLSHCITRLPSPHSPL